MITDPQEGVSIECCLPGSGVVLSTEFCPPHAVPHLRVPSLPIKLLILLRERLYKRFLKLFV